MATYEEEVLADDPLAFWRLKDGAGATVMTDISGSGNHGTYYNDAAFGFPPPVESDASAAAVAYRVGEGGATPKPTGNFAMEVWIYCPASGASSMGIAGVGQIGADGGIFISQGSGQIGVRFSTDGTTGTTVNMAYAVPVGDLFYHVGFSRNGTQLLLAVNGEEADTAVTSSDPITSTYTTQPWRVGVGGTGNLDAGIGTAEPVVYDHAVLLARFRAHYLAALNSLLLNGYSNVLPSAVWYSQPDKTPIHVPFRHNFEDTISERISFLTNNSKTVGGSIEGSELRPKPRREIEINYLARSDEERRFLRFKLWASQNRIWFLPIRQDFQQLESGLSSGVQTIPVSTQYMDYEVNNWVGVRQIDHEGKVVKAEVLRIDAVNPNDVHTTTSTLNSYLPYLSYAYPVRRGILSRSIPVRGHTDAVEETILVFELLPQDEAVVPNRIIPWTPTILYKGYEAHDPGVWQSHNWVDGRNYDVDRRLARIDFETGIFEVESDTPGAEEAFEYRMLLKGREKIAQFLGWFYSRGGSLTYLWVPSMQKDFDIVSSTSNDVTVAGLNYSENFALAEARRDLAFIYNDNTMALRRVLAFSGSSNETLSLGISGFPGSSNLKSLSLLKFCQMESDSIELAWVTDDLVQVAWRFKELLSTPA